MFKNTPFETFTKSLSENVPAFNPSAVQEAMVPLQDNMKAWSFLAASQAKEAQIALAQTVESFKGLKEPMAAFDVMKTCAENAIAMASKNLKDVMALGVSQFGSAVDTVQKKYPAPEAFANVGTILKNAAVTAENTLDSLLEKSATAMATVTGAEPAPAVKRSRATA